MSAQVLQGTASPTTPQGGRPLVQLLIVLLTVAAVVLLTLEALLAHERVVAIDWLDAFAEGLALAVVLLWLLLARRVAGDRSVYIPLMIGFVVLFVGFYQDLLDEFYVSPWPLSLENVIFFGMALMTIGFYRWSETLIRRRDEAVAMNESLLRTTSDLMTNRKALRASQKRTEEQVAELEETNQGLEREVLKRRQAEKEAFESSRRLQEVAQKLTVARADLEQAMAEKGEFLNVAAHELRTPLQPIIGYANRLMTQDDMPPRYKDKLQVILRSGERLLRLVQDVLDINKMETGVMKFTMEEVALLPLLQDVYESFEPSVAAGGLEFKLAVPRRLPAVAGDGQRLAQLLGDLLTNAIKFTEEGSITLAAHEEDDAVVISVTDTGIGIAAEHLPKLFQKFYQIETHAKRRHEGTGLGLAIAQAIARAHGGEITVTSELGVGSTFQVRLPKAGGTG